MEQEQEQGFALLDTSTPSTLQEEENAGKRSALTEEFHNGKNVKFKFCEVHISLLVVGQFFMNGDS